jgi:hypothetical protein
MVHPCLADVASSVITSRLNRQKNLFSANFRHRGRFPHARKYCIKDCAQCVQGCGRNSSSIYFRRISDTNADFRTPAIAASKTVLNVYRAAAGIRARSISGEFQTQTPISAHPAVPHQRPCSMSIGLRQEFELNLFPANFRHRRRFPHAGHCRIKDSAQCVQGCGRNSSSIYFRLIAHANADFRTGAGAKIKDLVL